MTKEEAKDKLLKQNKWPMVADLFCGKKLYMCDKQLVWPDERELKMLISHNNRQKNEDTKYILEIPPEPWSANILEAKVVILSLNPGYIDYLNRDLANMFSEKYAKQITEDKHSILYMKPQRESLASRILGDCYWYKALKRIGVDAYEEQNWEKVLDNVAVIQCCAYASKSKSLPKETLPSQEYTKKVIMYLAEYTKAQFLLMRAVSEWEKFLGEDFVKSLGDRWIVSAHYRNQTISAKNIGQNQYEMVIEALKSK